MAIPQSFIQELVARADVVEVVGRYVQLKKGGANYMGLCPFHGEKSPSFTVSPSKQFFHCFGCGKNGNAIGFLMEHTGMSFVDAVKDLAQSYGLQVPEDDTDPMQRQRAAQQRQHQATLNDVLEKAADSYRKHLKTSPKAVEKLLGRADRERGRLFAMKRAQAHVIGATFFQLHIATHDVHHIGARQQFLDKGLRYGHGYFGWSGHCRQRHPWRSHRARGPVQRDPCDGAIRSGFRSAQDGACSVAPDRSLAAGIGPAQPTPTDPLQAMQSAGQVGLAQGVASLGQSSLGGLFKAASFQP